MIGKMFVAESRGPHLDFELAVMLVGSALFVSASDSTKSCKVLVGPD